MKLVMTTAAAALISTAAAADNSTYYNDLRLDTSIGAEAVYGENTRVLEPGKSTKANDITFSTADDTFDADVVLSSKGDLRSPGEGYIYGGYGPGNDSR